LYTHWLSRWCLQGDEKIEAQSVVPSSKSDDINRTPSIEAGERKQVGGRI